MRDDKDLPRQCHRKLFARNRGMYLCGKIINILHFVFVCIKICVRIKIYQKVFFGEKI